MPREADGRAIALTRETLALSAAGVSNRAIAAALGLSFRRVKTITNGSAFVELARSSKPFVPRERDHPDYATVKSVLASGSSTLRVEHMKYAAHAPAPFSFTSFHRRYGEWLAACEDEAGRPVAPAPASIPHKPLSFGDGFVVSNTERVLEGGLLFIAEPGAALQIRTGALCVHYRDGTERTFPRGRHRVRSIILASPGASVTIEAMRFAADEGILLLVMHRSGESLTLLADAPTLDTRAEALELRRAQFSASPRQRLDIARAILALKIEASQLAEREADKALRDIQRARDHDELLIAEARAAMVYWRRYVGFEPRLTDRCPHAWRVFRGRLERHKSQAIPRWARNPVNAMLNYGYAVAGANCTRALVGLGLDPCFAFLHHGATPGRLSLSYDVVELVRPAVDACVFQLLLQSRVFDRKDFVEVRAGPRAGGVHVRLAPKTAREVALTVLKDVPFELCAEAADKVARVILSGELQTCRRIARRETGVLPERPDAKGFPLLHPPKSVRPRRTIQSIRPT